MYFSLFFTLNRVYFVCFFTLNCVFSPATNTTSGFCFSISFICSAKPSPWNVVPVWESERSATRKFPTALSVSMV